MASVWNKLHSLRQHLIRAAAAAANFDVLIICQMKGAEVGRACSMCDGELRYAEAFVSRT